VVGRGKLRSRKVKGRVSELARDMPARLSGQIGIGHTRWARTACPVRPTRTHTWTAPAGSPWLHNGVIENAEELRAKLIADGVKFLSETDTECSPT